MIERAEERRRGGGGGNLALAKVHIPAVVPARHSKLHAKRQSCVLDANSSRQALFHGHVRVTHYILEVRVLTNLH